MKLADGTSANVIDRRHAIGAAAGVLATLLAVFGIRAATRAPDPDRDLVGVVSTALDRGQDFWRTRVPGYQVAQVVLYDGSTISACGRALSSSGPFYCPGDQRIYVDLAFLRAIDGTLGRAYVIAHELGHHVQKVRGALGAGRQSTDVELEADCYAGIWMRNERDRGDLEVGDIPAALGEASAVGDDRLCPSCSAESWTHGSSSQRIAAVTRGLDAQACW